MTISLWCIVIAGLLPYAATAIAKAGRTGFDNENPRAWLARQEGYRARANAAQFNSFEVFPFFAAAVIVAYMLHGPQARADQLAMLFVAARVLYIAFYVAGRGTLRSLAWLVGMLAVLGLFFAT
jgi:uncharacterized MAPEG superfamily protein